MRFWNNRYQICSKLKRLESQIILTYLGARKLSGIKRNQPESARISLLDTRLHWNLNRISCKLNLMETSISEIFAN